MNECCSTCKKKLDLVKYDYSDCGCTHTKYDGYACTIFGSEGLIVHMVGCNPDEGRCEEYSPKEEVTGC